MSKAFTKKEEDYLIKSFKKTNNITKTAKKFCKKNKLNYDDNFRKRVSSFLDRKKLTNNKIRLEDSDEFKEALNRKLSDSKFYIVTWEQNETPLHENFWNNILTYKEFLGAELSVILGRYKNPTSVFTDRQNENWNEATRPYWDASRHDIHKFLTVLSDVKIRPTRKYPLTGLQGLAQNKSIIVGHPKLHLKSEPTLNGYPNKMVFTTGAVTVPNYTDSSTGKIAANSHKLGFVIVEIRNEKIFHIRQVEADSDGNFIDLIHELKDQEVSIVNYAEGLVCGDSHYGHLDPKIDIKNDEICERFNIDKLVLHDAIDGESCNNHIIKSPIEQFKRLQEGKHLMEDELEGFAKWLKGKLKYNPIIPQANHNNRFDRILEQDWRKDIPNSLTYFKYTTAVLEGKADKGVLAYFIKEKFGEQVTCLSYTDSYKIGKYECSQHGDYGANGSRGSTTAFRNLDIPMIVAHSHTTFRADDLFYAGTNTYLNLGYNERGASSWGQSNVLVAKNGIAQHLIFVKGQFTTFDI